MTRGEERLLGRRSGLRIMKASLALGAAGVAPLALYIAFGPKDGNPIGLGLLAMASVPLAGMGLAVGAVVALVQLLERRER